MENLIDFDIYLLLQKLKVSILGTQKGVVREKFDIKIPRGEWNQMSLCIPGKGEASLFSKRRGNLILDLKIQKNMSRINIEKSSFSYEMVIDKSKIGRVLTLNSSEGPIKFVLPRNTVSGQTFCLRAGSEQNHILKVHLS